jgi:TIR domain-containing protein/WD40 domain-containing protein
VPGRDAEASTAGKASQVYLIVSRVASVGDTDDHPDQPQGCAAAGSTPPGACRRGDNPPVRCPDEARRLPAVSEVVRDAEMSGDAAQRPVVIFLSYRRGDTQWAARGIYDRLVNSYDRRNVFRDLDAIPAGVRFRDYIEKKISESDVFILLIGKAWASYEDELGRRRLELPRDPVRLEVETALKLGKQIIPVLIGGAPMPTERDLIPSILDLLEFNAAEVSDSRWEYDLGRLLRAVDEAVERSRRSSELTSAEDSIRPAASTTALEEPQHRTAHVQPDAGPDMSMPRQAAISSSARDALERGTRRDAEEQVRRDAEHEGREEDDLERHVHPGGAQPTRLEHEAAVRAVAFSPDSARLATASRDGVVRIAEVATGREIAQLPHQAGVFGVAFCPGGWRLVAASSDRALLWDLRTNRQLRWFAHDDRVWAVAFSPDGTRLVTASHDRSARLWDASNGQELARFLHGAPVAGVAFSPDGARVATASDDKTACTWDVITGDRLARVAHEGAVADVAFSPDGDKLATAGSDGTARIWNSANGVKLTEVKHDGPVHGVAYSPTGSRLATASYDHTARVWNPIRGIELKRLPHDGRVWAVAFSPDGRSLATGSHDRLARIWTL